MSSAKGIGIGCPINAAVCYSLSPESSKMEPVPQKQHLLELGRVVKKVASGAYQGGSLPADC